jgi:LmbE family N-acetylglucosaminyl deacetylase
MSGIPVTIFTVFAGDPATSHYSIAARLLHRTCGLTTAPVAQRRAEDRHAGETLSAAVRHGPYLDAVYRTRPDGSWLIGPRDGPRDATPAPERPLVEAITTTIRDLIAELRPALVLTCASFGDHVDHQHTCAAVRAAAAAAGVPVRLWSDVPYLTGPVTAFPDTLRHRSGPHRALPYRVTAGGWGRKLAAVARYRSQHALLWPGEGDVGGVLERQAEEVGRAFGGSGCHELFWRPVPQVLGARPAR